MLEYKINQGKIQDIESELMKLKISQIYMHQNSRNKLYQSYFNIRVYFMQRRFDITREEVFDNLKNYEKNCIDTISPIREQFLLDNG
jgi:hypothetical protein